jgi:hypothetical protein
MDPRILRDRFRDDAQLGRVREVVQLRLADDRDQDECRYLMRFWWQLGMAYTEVRDDELDEHVSPTKRAILDRLFAALEQGHEAIDHWIQEAEATLPVIEDRGARASGSNGEGESEDIAVIASRPACDEKLSPPRGRLYQHSRLTSRELDGAVIERAVCWRSDRGDPSRCGLLWIKPNNRPWQRFFLDAGFAVWEEWSDDDTTDEFAELADELEELSTTVGEHLGTVTFDDTGAVVPTIRIALGARREVRLAPRDPNDTESATFLELR